MDVQHFFDSDTSTLTYVVFDSKSRDAVIIDPVLEYDPASGIIEGRGLKELVAFITKHHLTPHLCLETHAHADHLSSSQYLKEYFPNIKIGISANIQKVQKAFKDILNLGDQFCIDGSQFDRLIQDYERFHAGTIEIHAIPTPGHTPACMSFHIGKMVFCGDALFIEDSGTGRCDFPGGNANDLFISVHEHLYSLSEDTIVFVGHDYQPDGRELKFETTIGASKRHNIHINQETNKDDYIKFRETRDKTLKVPRLLFASIQVNIDGGVIPREMKIPVYDKVHKRES